MEKVKILSINANRAFKDHQKVVENGGYPSYESAHTMLVSLFKLFIMSAYILDDAIELSLGLNEHKQDYDKDIHEGLKHSRVELPN